MIVSKDMSHDLDLLEHFEEGGYKDYKLKILILNLNKSILCIFKYLLEQSSFLDNHNFCFVLGYRNNPNETDPYGLSPQYWHVFAARLAFVVVFEVMYFYIFNEKQVFTIIKFVFNKLMVY